MRARVDHVLPDYAPSQNQPRVRLPHSTSVVESLGLLNGVRRVSASELVFFRSVIRVSTVR